MVGLAEPEVQTKRVLTKSSLKLSLSKERISRLSFSKEMISELSPRCNPLF
jgi:hypothetical protein